MLKNSHISIVFRFGVLSANFPVDVVQSVQRPPD
jgi:hypothetical protein